jgi:tetratricopeptide (TPR) repeat protein
VAVLSLGTAACSNGSDTEQAAERLASALDAHQEGRLDDAVELYKEVLDLDPQSKFAYYNLALIHQTRGSNALAQREYREALAIDPEFVPALFNLAILQTREDSTEAIGLYRHVLLVQPDYAAAHLNLGFLLIDTGDDKSGRAELEDAVALDPASPPRIPEASRPSSSRPRVEPDEPSA